MNRRANLGFTLIELIVALVLLALAGSILFGSISLATQTWDRGEGKANQTRQMRLTTQFLRTTLHTAHPVKVMPTGESPLPFAGTSEEMSFPGLLPERVGGGLFYFRLALKPGEKTSQLTLQRVVPDIPAQPQLTTALPDPPSFADAETSVLADDIRSVKLQYFGKPSLEGGDLAPPTWKDRWDDKISWPQMIKIEVTPAEGPPWPPFVAELKLAAQAACDPARRAQQQCDQQ